MTIIENNATKKYERDDFNMLYDYLWRDRLIAHSTAYPGNALYGKNKAIRAAAEERIRTIDNILQYMKNIERDNLVFKDGKIIRKDTEGEV